MKPSFYDKFYCTADKCDFTCCQQWKIGVDDNTFEKWKKYNTTDSFFEAENMKCTGCLSAFSLSEMTHFKDEQRVVKLNSNNKCPYLNNKGLCNVVLTYGEENISETCHIFPREIHEFDNHKEETLMPCCPYVIDLLNETEKYELTDIPAGLYNTDIFDVRNHFMDIILEGANSIEEDIRAIFFMMLDLEENDSYSPAIWKQLDEVRVAVSKVDIDIMDSLNECNELFLDVIDNYRKEGLYKEYLNDLGETAEQLEELLEDGTNDEEILNSYELFKEKWNSYDALIRKIIAHDIYGDLILPEADFESMTIKFQWIALEYAVLRQMCFLHFYKNDGELTYEVLRSFVVLTFRMTGYEEDDIYEYLENSFQEIIWEWGYMALIMS